MATAASVSTDLTTCSICNDTYDNPKSLPCLHAFCLKCLQHIYRDKSPGDEEFCPVCGEEFRIPAEGIKCLKHHIIVQQLLDNERQRNQLRGSHCDEHKEKEVELYCCECEKNICMKCYAVKHRKHNSGLIRLIPEVADNFRFRIDNDNQQVLSGINMVRERSSQTTRDASEFLSKVEGMKRKVLAAGDVIKRSVDSQINDIFTKLQSATSESDKQAESAQEAYQLAIESMESFHTYSRELLDKGRPSDITDAAYELHDRATKLLCKLNSDVTADKYRPPHVTFTPADVTQVKRLRLVGQVTVGTDEQPGIPYVLH